MTNDDSANSVQAKDVYGVAGANEGTVNQTFNHYVSQTEPEEAIKRKPLKKASPYLGLEKFQTKDKDKFFGREQWITDLSRYLLEPNNNVLLLLGASGSGKSSLIGAGLIPRLEDDWGAFTNLTFVPDVNPFVSLGYSLASIYGQARAGAAQTIAAETLVQVVQSLKQDQQWLIFIDQFEELFTRTAKATCDVFVAGLVQLIQTYQQDGSLKIVLTMRADFLDRLSPYPDLGIIHDRHSRILTDMTDYDLKLAIEEPAARNGVVFESGLVSHIIDDFRIDDFRKRAGSLPLLQYTLDLLWKNDDITDRVLNQKTYDDLGGVTGALQKQADKVYNGLTKAEKEAAKQILLEVVKLDNEKPVSRRIDKATFLQDATKAAVLEKLIQARLLVSRDEQQQAKVEVAHEALLREWEVIKSLVEENREMILLRERLNADARQWQERAASDPEKARDELWSGSKLERVLELKNDGVLKDLDSTVTAFITAGIEWSSLQLTKEQAQNKKLQLALTEATLREQATRVLNWLPLKPLEAAVIAIQTMGLNLEQIPGSPLGSVQMGVQQAMEKGRRVPATIFQGHEASVNSVAFAPDGQTIVSGSDDKTIRLWDLQGNAIGSPFQGHEASVNSVAFAPDGQTIVSGSGDKTMRLWDLQGNAIGTPFQGHESSVRSVAFAPDGQTIVSGSDDNTIRLWDLQGNAIGSPFQGHESSVRSVAFAPDGQTIVSGSADNTIRLWDLQGNAIGSPFQGHESSVMSVAFAPDGQTIVSGSYDNTIRLWDLQGNAIGSPFQGHESSVSSVVFAPDGQTIVSGSYDNTIRLWDLQGSAIGQPFQGHEHYVMSVAFAPDGQTIVSGSLDNTIRLWDLQGNAIGQPFQGHKQYVSSVAFAPDGQTIVSGSNDNTIRLWDLQGNAIGQPFQGHESSVSSVAFAPDGQTIVSGSIDGAIRLWDLQGNAIGSPFRGHEGYVSSVAFAPDGQTIVSGSGDKTIRLWDLQGNPIGQPFQGHESSVSSVAFAPDGQTIVSGGGSAYGTIRLWDLQGNAVGTPFQGHESYVRSVAFAPDGQTIVSGSDDRTIRLWDLQGNAIGAPFQGHEDFVFSVAFAPDGQTIVSGSEDKTIRLWDLQGNAIGQPFQGHEGYVESVAFAPDGQTIVSGSADQTIRLWRGHWQAWLEVCCKRLRYHPVFNTPSEVFREPTLIQMAEEACETCRKYVWEPQAKKAELLHTDLKQGIESFQAKDYRAALQHFDRVIGAGANQPRAYHGRGYCRAHLGNKPAAIADLQRAAKLYQATGQDKPHQQVIDLLQKLQPS